MNKKNRRQTGRSLKQILNTEPGCFFVCQGHKHYYRRLAEYAGRNDITIVDQSFLVIENLRGRAISEIEIDHHAKDTLTRGQWKAWHSWFTHHRGMKRRDPKPKGS